MITYLLAVQGALLPACVCMKGVMMYDRMEEDDMKRTLEACYCYNVECFFFSLSMRDSQEVCVRVCF